LPSFPTPPPPTRGDFIDMPSPSTISAQHCAARPTSPPMPSRRPPLPPQVSPVHATGSNGSTYSSQAEQVNMPEDPGYVGVEGRLFNMDDDEDLYGERPWNKNGKVVDRGGGQKSDNCIVQ